jgi:hypothetical protein
MTADKQDQHRSKLADPAKKPKSSADADLNEALEDSFPASDPPSITQPETEIGAPHGRHEPEQNKR